MRVPFVLLDVFTEAPFSGNQLCVVPETPEGLGADTMLTLAREIAFSETTFVTAVRPRGYDVRIFTPEKELPFAGHPTLGTAFALASSGRTGSDVVQRCGAGETPVTIDVEAGRGRMRQLPPVFGRELDEAIHYGCHYLRPCELYDGFDNAENPSTVENLVAVTGVAVIDYKIN